MNEKGNILLAIGCSKIGGAQKVFATLAKQLGYLGYNVTVLLPEGPLAEMLRTDNISTTIIKFKSIHGIRTIAGLLKTGKFDIINTHLTNCSFLIAVINIFYRKKLCCSLHNAIIHEGLSRVQKLIYPYLYYIIYKLSDGIIVNSEKNKDHFIHTGHISPGHIRVIYNGINAGEYMLDHNYRKPGDTKFQIGYVGRLSIEKGVTYLIKALAKLRHLDFECNIIGEGPLRIELEQEVASLNLTDKIHFHGFQTNVVPFFQKMDVFVLPSLNEVLPITIIEAFALKVVAIAAEVGGVPDLITNEKTGLLFPAKDFDKLAENIDWVYKNSNKSKVLVENAYQKFTQTFTSAAMVSQITDYYDFIIYKS